MVRINVQTPFDDGGSSSRRKEGWPVRRQLTIGQVKDEVANGKFREGERWERKGMRLVWQGRIVSDEETVGDIVGIVGATVSEVLVRHLAHKQNTVPTL